MYRLSAIRRVTGFRAVSDEAVLVLVLAKADSEDSHHRLKTKQKKKKAVWKDEGVRFHTEALWDFHSKRIFAAASESPEISNMYSKRWVELNHSHNFCYLYAFILLLLSWNLYSYSKARHQNEIRKVFLRRFPLNRFLAKTPRVNNIPIKSFSKICRSKSTLNCSSRHSCIKLKHPT